MTLGGLFVATKERLEDIYSLLNEVLPNKVYYALYVEDNVEVPFIVYQEISKNPKTYADDLYLLKQITIQITLVTKNKDVVLEDKLEDALDLAGIDFRLISEYPLIDTGIYRIYEIKMEEFKNE